MFMVTNKKPQQLLYDLWTIFEQMAISKFLSDTFVERRGNVGEGGSCPQSH